MRDLIYAVVERFYEKATKDVLIGYHFAKFSDPEVLAHHLERITSFWEMQFTGNMTKPLEGNPFRLLFTHLQLNIHKGELGRWVMLFNETLNELEKALSPEELESLKEMIAEWRKRIEFFKMRFEAHPQMFNKN